MKRFAVLACAAILAATPALPGQPVPQGPRFQVSETAGRHLGPDVAVGPFGEFVVVWSIRPPGGVDVFTAGRRFDSRGNPAGGTFLIGESTFSQFTPMVTVDGQGNFTVVWMSFGRDGDGAGIFGQRFDRGGRKIGAEFQVNETTAGDQHPGDIDSDGDGNLLVVWQGEDPSAFEALITVRRFDAATSSFGPEMVVASDPLPFYPNTDAALAESGEFVVVWTHYVVGGYGYEHLVGRRFDGSTQPLGAEFQVSHGDPSYFTQDTASQVDSTPDGRFAVVWERRVDADVPLEVDGRRYDASGTAQGAEFLLSEPFALSPTAADLAMAADGSFVSTWVEQGVRAERIDAAGNSDGGFFTVDDGSGAHHFGLTPTVARHSSGNVVFTWSRTPDFSTGEIFARLYLDGCAVPGVEGLEAALSPGGDVLLRWTDAPNAVDYVVFEDTGADGDFLTPSGTAATGPAGLTVSAAGGTRYYLVAGRNPACGLGPLK